MIRLWAAWLPLRLSDALARMVRKMVPGASCRRTQMNKEVIRALDRVIEYLAVEQEDYENSDPSRRQNHIWPAVQVLVRHRADLADDA